MFDDTTSESTREKPMPPYVPPNSGDLPEHGKHILKDVYVSLRKKGADQESAAKQAWGAVTNAGYFQDKTGHWHAPKKKDQEMSGYTHTLRDPETGQYDENRSRNAFIAYQMWSGVPADEAKGRWNKMSETQQQGFTANHIPPDLLSMFDQEKQEHSGFSDAQIWQLVQDHVKAGKREAAGETNKHPPTPTTGPPDGADAGSGKIEHFPPEETQGYAVNYPNRIKAKESFSWTTPFKLIAEAGKLLIKGAAITIGKTKNKGTYTKDELMRGARTLAAKPIYHNHLETVQEAQLYLQGVKPDGAKFNPATIPDLVRKNIQSMINSNDMSNGNVTDSEFEGDAVEYVGEITRPTAIAMADAGLIKGPSIGAVPRNQDLKNPRGIIFTDISIITEPETPADPDATMKVVEKLREMVAEPPLSVRIHENLMERYELTTTQRLQVQRRMQELIAAKSNEARNRELAGDNYQAEQFFRES